MGARPGIQGVYDQYLKVGLAEKMVDDHKKGKKLLFHSLNVLYTQFSNLLAPAAQHPKWWMVVA